MVHHYLQRHLITEVKNIVSSCNVSFPTANKSLQHLCQLGIVKEITGKTRNKIYVYQKYLDILNEGAGPIHEAE
jgi:ribosomal protein S25